MKNMNYFEITHSQLVGKKPPKTQNLKVPNPISTSPTTPPPHQRRKKQPKLAREPKIWHNKTLKKETKKKPTPAMKDSWRN